MNSEAEATARALVDDFNRDYRARSGRARRAALIALVTRALIASYERGRAKENARLYGQMEALAASRAEGEGQVSVLRDALQYIAKSAELALLPESLQGTAERTCARIEKRARKALTTTAAAAQAHDAAVAREAALIEREKCVWRLRDMASSRDPSRPEWSSQRREILDAAAYTLEHPADEAAAKRALRDDGPSGEDT